MTRVCVRGNLSGRFWINSAFACRLRVYRDFCNFLRYRRIFPKSVVDRVQRSHVTLDSCYTLIYQRCVCSASGFGLTVRMTYTTGKTCSNKRTKSVDCDRG